MMERKHLHGITLLGGLAMALLCGCIRDELEAHTFCDMAIAEMPMHSASALKEKLAS